MANEQVTKPRCNTGLCDRGLDLPRNVIGSATAGLDTLLELPDHDSAGNADGLYGSPKRKRIVLVLPNHGIEIT